MKRKDAEPIGKILQTYLRQEGLETPLNEQRLLSAWPEIMGEGISGYTKGLFIRNQVLYVHLTSSVLRNDLMMCREMLVDKLNKHVGAQVIVNIIFR